MSPALVTCFISLSLYSSSESLEVGLLSSRFTDEDSGFREAVELAQVTRMHATSEPVHTFTCAAPHSPRPSACPAWSVPCSFSLGK